MATRLIFPGFFSVQNGTPQPDSTENGRGNFQEAGELIDHDNQPASCSGYIPTLTIANQGVIDLQP